MKKLFIVLETSIYLLFISLDLLKIDTTLIKYLSIMICFIFTLINNKRYRILAMSFTLIADLFLLVLNKYYEIGVSSFIIVQIIYLLFIRSINDSHFKKFLIIRLSIIFVGLIILYLINYLSLLNILVIIYFSNLVVNMLQAFYIRKDILAIGLLLFVGCDICVGLHNILSYNSLISLLMWVFYLPSQVLIVLA